MPSGHERRNTAALGELAAFSPESKPQGANLKFDDGLDAFPSERDQVVAPPTLLALDSPVLQTPIAVEARRPRRTAHRAPSLAAAGLVLATGTTAFLAVFWLVSDPTQSSPQASAQLHGPAASPGPSSSRPTGAAAPPTTASLRESKPLKGAASIAPPERKQPKEKAVRDSSKVSPPDTTKRPVGRAVRGTPPAPPAGRKPVVSLPPAKARDAGRNASARPAPASVIPAPRAAVPGPEVRESANGAAVKPVPNLAPISLSPSDGARRTEESPLPGATPPERVPRALLRDEDEVRAVLSRYQSAYERLDAAAAKDIWPSLNERALSRAFEGLESQEVAFNDCRLMVTGSRAQASCSGTARYVKRVGSKASQREPRQWTFKLSKDSNAWKIDAVQTR